MARSIKTDALPNKKEPGLRIALKLNNDAQRPKELAGLDEKGKWGDTFPLLPLIESVKPKRLAELMKKARENDPEAVLPDFSCWYQIISPAAVDPDKLARVISKSDIVETAYVMRPVPPPVNASNDPRSVNQGYLNAGPDGIDARYAWALGGGDGAGVGFVDMEQGWNLNHKDLKAAGVILISGINHDYYPHGTSVLGEILMVDNSIGGVGIAPGASGRVVSQWRTQSSNSPNNPDAIVSAASIMEPGDVLLLEAQELAPLGARARDETGAETQARSYWPVEVADATYDAILFAIAREVVVIEAAGNGANDLEAYKSPSGKRIFNRNLTGFRDSGAIIVGAASSASPHRRLGFSNYGNRIDCYAWGENIDTTTTNAAGTTTTTYTRTFNGTSGAAPIVAGAALILQSRALRKFGRRYTPRQLRQILKTNGTPSAAPATDKIGVMPDLQAIITANGLVP